MAMITPTYPTDGRPPRSKLLAGHPVHDPAASLWDCDRVTRLMRALLWYDAGEAAWREAWRHQSVWLKHDIWMSQN